MRMEKVNKRRAGWVKLLGKLTECTCAVAIFSGGAKDSLLPWKDAPSIWVGPQQHFTTIDIQTR